MLLRRLQNKKIGQIAVYIAQFHISSALHRAAQSCLINFQNRNSIAVYRILGNFRRLH